MLTSPAAIASQGIAVKLDAAGTFDGNMPEISVILENKGCSVIYGAEITTTLGQMNKTAARPDELPPGGVSRKSISFPAPPQPAGLHQAVITARYQDATGMQHSSVATVALLTANIDHIPRLIERSYPILIRLRPGKSVEFSPPAPLEDRTVQWNAALPDAFDTEYGNNESAMYRITATAQALPGRYRGWLICSYTADDTLYSESIPLYLIVTTTRLMERFATTGTALVLAAMIMLFAAGFSRIAVRTQPHALTSRVDAIALMAVFAVIAWHIPPAAILRNEMVLGGDTPAHLYITAHLKTLLFEHGRITGWAHGWWCGFPLFRYYFPLPYLTAAVISLIMPLNIAFRIVSVSGIFALPLSCYLSGRILRLPRPAPLFMAVAALPVLFDHSHTMWGVNIYSTMAGMLANSFSFALLPPALAMVVRDTRDGCPRPSTVCLMTALILSHFFTSIIAALALCGLLLPGPADMRKQRLLVMTVIATAAGLLSAWWWLPLVTEIHYSMEFGTNWDVKLWSSLPWVIKTAAIIFPAAIFICYRKAQAFASVMTSMLLAAVLLFFLGERISAVFINIRLWPFITWGLMTGTAVGIAYAMQYTRFHRWCTGLFILAVCLTVFSANNHTRQWTEWNYRGAGQLDGYSLFRQMLKTVENTPGRLAVEMHPHNQSLGSSRIFESAPLLAGKALIEGGLVNSALGALPGYYIQSLTSPAYAGLPPVVNPAETDIARAALYLELAGVSHFIARGKTTRAGFDLHPRWQPLHDTGPWRIYEHSAEHIRHVHVIKTNIPAVTLAANDLKTAAMLWLETPAAINQPYILRPPQRSLPTESHPEISLNEFRQQLEVLKQQPVPEILTVYDSSHITNETVHTHSIRFRTSAIGQPHLIKTSWAPGWQVRGAAAVYPVSPLFMLVYPTETEVELYYGYTTAARSGHFMCLCGLAVFAIIAFYRRKRIKDESLTI